MDKALSKVSVIIPCYNAKDTIADCLHGIIQQNYLSYEIIVVDDASTDNSWEILQSIPGIILLRNEKNRGPAYSRNKAIRHAQGEIILLIDSDSKITDPELIKKHALAHINQNIGILGGGIQGIGRGIVAKADKYSHWFLNIPHSSNRIGTHLVTNNMSVERKIFDRIGFFNEKLITGEDTDFCERARKTGISLGLISDIVILHKDREKFINFLKCFYCVGRDRIPIRQMHRYRYWFLLPFGPISSLFYCLPLALLLTIQVVMSWFPYDKKVILYTPLIFSGRLAMAMGIVSHCFYRRFCKEDKRP